MHAAPPSLAGPPAAADWHAPVRPAAGGVLRRGRLPSGKRLFLAAAFLVGIPFYFAGQSWNTSAAAAFTETAEEMEARASGGNALRQIAFLTLGGCGVWCLARDRRHQARPRPAWWSPRMPGGRLAGLLREWAGVARRAHPVAWTLALYIAWCFASVLWSHEPGQTVRKLVVLGCWTAGSLGVARALEPRRIIWLGVLLPALYLLIGVLAELSLGTFRPWAGDYRFAGTMHPNSQGLTLASMIAGAFVLWQSERREAAQTGANNGSRRLRWGWRLPALIAAGALFTLLTKSRTSAAGLVLCLGLLTAIAVPPRWRLAATVSGGTFGGLFLLVALSLGSDPLGGALDAATLGRKEQISSLTGRHEIWEEIGRFTDRRPLAGFGYDTFWTPEHVAIVSENCGWGLREAHSAYRDVLLSVGLIGLWLLVPALVWGWFAAARRYAAGERRAEGRPGAPGVGTGDPLAGYVAGLLAVGLLNAFTESAMSMVLFTPFLICCGLAKLYVFPQETVSPFAGGRDASPPAPAP
ncbi:O-antigen ligase family protein [Alienimonas californiensis]|uniref:O-Antigen ligase n=1 Tax=Alienimonas californiensis TaxID=2527989 RepID=A0A517PEH1_9PLAN|nr:O-antigen ligase family protein [Alienimonas californiensis]QDT17758.1 O-Antigen ligase [Alienimonas californiensis]